MSDVHNLFDFAEAKEARKMRDLITRLDDIAKAEGIEPQSYLGAYHDGVMLVFGQVTALLIEDRAHRQEHRRLTIEQVEAAQEVANTYLATAKAELAKLDRMARVSEANTRHFNLKLQDDTAKMVERLSGDLVRSVREGNIIRQKAYSQTQFLKTVTAIVIAVFMVLGLGFAGGRMTAPAPMMAEETDGR